MKSVLWFSVLFAVICWVVWSTLAADKTPIFYRPFRCRKTGWPVSITVRCDNFSNCLDGSDEQGCVNAEFVQVPPTSISIAANTLLNLTCTGSGVPLPTIGWKYNGRDVGGNCDWISEDGVGQLSCRMRLIDSGNYSCTARQPSGRLIHSAETVVSVTGNACREGYFSELGKKKLCVKCFCNGVSTLCQAANLFKWNYTMEMNSWKMKYAIVDGIRNGSLDVKCYDKFDQVPKNVTPYYKLPFKFIEYQVGSYDGNLQYEISVDNSSYSKQEPDVILRGHNTTLTFKYKPLLIPNQSNRVVLRLHEANFRHLDGQKASREDLMIALSYIDTFLVRMYPLNGTYMPADTDIVMDASTTLGYHGLGKMERVEECRCPHSCYGTSCERCAYGYKPVDKYLVTGICFPWKWHGGEWAKASTPTTKRRYHYV